MAGQDCGSLHPRTGTLSGGMPLPCFPDVASASGPPRQGGGHRQPHLPWHGAAAPEGVAGQGRAPAPAPYSLCCLFLAFIVHPISWDFACEEIHWDVVVRGACGPFPGALPPLGLLGCKRSWVCKGTGPPGKGSGDWSRCGAAGWLLFTHTEPTARDTLNCIFWLKFLFCKLFLLNLSCVYRVISVCINYNRL